MKHFIFLFIFLLVLSNVLLSQTNVYDFNFDFKRIKNPAIRIDFGWDNSSLRGNDKETLTNSLSSFGLDFGFASTQDFFPIEKKVKYAFTNDTISSEQKRLFNKSLTDNSFWGLGLSLKHYTNSNNTYNNFSGAFVVNFIRMDGSGYKFGGNSNLKLLTGSNMAWYWLDYSYADEKPPPPSGGEPTIQYADINCFEPFSSIRFGTKYRSEVSFQFMRGVSICGEANRMVIFPRTLFWKYVGSEMVYSIGGGVVSYFTGKIKTSNPYVYPVVDFILKTGLNFGISELQKDKMNWPYNTAPPLIIDQYRIGLQLEFGMVNKK